MILPLLQSKRTHRPRSALQANRKALPPSGQGLTHSRDIMTQMMATDRNTLEEMKHRPAVELLTERDVFAALPYHSNVDQSDDNDKRNCDDSEAIE
jgi:hypothetical protein